MEREELLGQVNSALETEGRTLTLSEETINGELDDALEDVTDDAQVDETFVKRLVKRLTRMDGNLHKDVSTQVKAYKKTHPAPKKGSTTTSQGGENGNSEEDVPDYIKKLNARLDAFEQSQKTAKEAEVKNATLKEVKKGLKTKFQEANLDVNDYFLNQALRELKLPELEEGESYDVDDLVNKSEKLYHKHLKAAGLDKKDSDKPRFGSRAGAGGKGETAADRFFNRKGKKEGWKK